ncbi:uncharacterized protein LTR77_007597 [Saxophila tyrrhenica]|uniref:Lipocalin/cytosolic fatty-acid binding domain-containing protein n=1 Tax=Saxophila tyrrhenica TaxID=1690608 RepID=A0AAV9P6J4_9PEZI|nr:hypothetical protein LTR77_007597 [Saxophila tyrrhenica]
MRLTTTVLTLASTATALAHPRSTSPSCNDTTAPTTTSPPVTAAQYDGHCFYPVPDPKFNLHNYLGTWYQVAGTPFGPTAGARCVTANYQLFDNNTVRVENIAAAGPSTFSIVGTGTAADMAYGTAGVFEVNFPSAGPPGQGGLTSGSGGAEEDDCPGPNYIVQDYAIDWAIVQTQRWNTLYILSRVREPSAESIQAWIDRAVEFGSNRTMIQLYNQTGCEGIGPM